MIRRFTALLLIGLLVLFAVGIPNAYAHDFYTVQVDGAIITLPLGAVLSGAHCLMVNADFISAVFGETTHVTGSGNRLLLDGRVAFVAGQSAASIGDYVVELEETPFISDGRLYIPLPQLLYYFSMEPLINGTHIVIVPKSASARVLFENGGILEIANLYDLQEYAYLASSTAHLYVQEFQVEWAKCELLYSMKVFEDSRMNMQYAYSITSPSGEVRPFLLNIAVTDQTQVWFEDSRLEQMVQLTLGTEDLEVADLSRLTDLYATASSLKGLEYATTLKTFALTDDGIEDFGIIGNLTALETLELVSTAQNPVDMEQWVRLENLRNVSISAPNIQNIEALGEKSTLEKLYIESPSLTSVDFLRSLPGLTELSLLNTASVPTLEPLRGLTGLQKLSLSIDRDGIFLSDLLAVFPQLLELELYVHTSSGILLDPVLLPSLLSAVLSGTVHSHNVRALSGAPLLSSLLIDSDDFIDLSALLLLPQLDFLVLQNDTITDFSGLSALSGLRQLYLYSNTATEVGFLAQLPDLTSLGIAGLRFSDLSAIAELKELDTLQVNCPAASDFSFLRGLARVRTLDLQGSNIRQAEDLSGLYNLISLNLENTPLRLQENFNQMLVMAALETNGDGFYDLGGEIDHASRTIVFRSSAPVPRPYALNVKGASNYTEAAYRQNDTLLVTTADGSEQIWKVIVASEKDLISLKADVDGDGVYETDGVVSNPLSTVTLYTDPMPDGTRAVAFQVRLCDEGATYLLRRSGDMAWQYYLDVTYSDGEAKTYTLLFEPEENRPSVPVDEVPGKENPNESVEPELPPYVEGSYEGHWAEASIEHLVQAGILDDDPLFYPQREATRLDFIVWCVRAMGLDLEQYETVSLPFFDVQQVNEDKLSYVKAAYGAGLVVGMQTGEGYALCPNEPVRRSEIAAMLGRVLKKRPGERLMELTFSDKEEVPGWAYNAVVLLCSRGILKGYEDQTLRIQNHVTRAEVAALLERAFLSSAIN